MTGRAGRRARALRRLTGRLRRARRLLRTVPCGRPVGAAAPRPAARPGGVRPAGGGGVAGAAGPVAAGVLVLLGLANLLAVDGVAPAGKQAAVAVVGLALMVLARRLRAEALTVVAVGVYAVAVAGLVVVRVAGVSANGATRWIAVGPLTLQPSELAKAGVLLLLAVVLGSGRPEWQRLPVALVVAAVPVALTALQPDLSTATLLSLAAVAVLVTSRVSVRAVAGLVGAAVVAAPLAVGLLRPYQAERLAGFLGGSGQDPGGAGWAVEQARIAVGSAPLWGHAGDPLAGLLASYLPERDTDLAPASVVQQFGPVAGAVLVLAAGVLVWRLAVAARECRTPQAGLVAAGMAVLFGVEVVVSTGGNLGLLPLAGVPFPLVSFGGTALVVHLVAIGSVFGLRRDGVRRALWSPPSLRRRPRLVRVLAAGVVAVLLGFVAAAATLQGSGGAALAATAHDQSTRCVPVPATRGAIRDRGGAVLAGATERTAPSRVDAVPAMLLADPAGLARLAGLLGTPQAALRARLAAVPATTPTLPVAEVAPGLGDRIDRTGPAGVLVRPSARRAYPTGALFGPLLGFVGRPGPADLRADSSLTADDVVGRAGLEAQYDAVLRGVDGQQCFSVTPAGVPVAPAERRAPVPGADVVLAVDTVLQIRLARSLQRALDTTRNPRAIASAVALDPRTGQVRAMVSLPAYDGAVFGPPTDAAAAAALARAPGGPMLQHATRSAVPPGSTFKLVVAAADTASGVQDPGLVVPTGAELTVAGHTFHNWRPMGPMAMTEALAWSNDVYFYKLALALGPERLVGTARALGVGTPTGVDLPGESGGLLGSPSAGGEPWYVGTTVQLGIGQGPVEVTPLQNARWTAAIATGRLVTPRLAVATGSAAAGFSPVPAPPPRPLPFAATLGPVRDGMRAVVAGGTGSALATLPFPVGAKTGTAQDGSLPGEEYDNWITAAAPFDDPSVVVTVLVQGPPHAATAPDTVAAEGLRQALVPAG